MVCCEGGSYENRYHKIKNHQRIVIYSKKNQNSLFEIHDLKFGNLGTISNNWVIKYIY